MCLKQEQWVKQNMGPVERLQFPFIVIICPMARVAAPLALLVWKMWPKGEVAVRMPSGARGHDALIVHGIRHRRTVIPPEGGWDQYKGVQSDPAREHLTLTRGEVWTTMGVEHDPYAPWEPVPHATWRAGTRPGTEKTESKMEHEGIHLYAKKRNLLLVRSPDSLPLFNLTGHDGYNWRDIYNCVLYAQPDIRPWTEDEYAIVQKAAGDVLCDLAAAQDGRGQGQLRQDRAAVQKHHEHVWGNVVRGRPTHR
jgi:hypothetical protein